MYSVHTRNFVFVFWLFVTFCNCDYQPLAWKDESRGQYVQYMAIDYDIRGPLAQWITRLTTNQKIACSSPARIGSFLYVTKGGLDKDQVGT